jgi:hypothetical protein
VRKKVLTVTAKDCELQTFRAGGNGGQNQNKRDTGVRWIHHPSGARGESREHRTQWQNKKAAWKRMVDTPQFKYWVAVETGRVEDREKWLARMMEDKNFVTEIKVDGKWVIAPEQLQ